MEYVRLLRLGRALVGSATCAALGGGAQRTACVADNGVRDVAGAEAPVARFGAATTVHAGRHGETSFRRVASVAHGSDRVIGRPCHRWIRVADGSPSRCSPRPLHVGRLDAAALLSCIRQEHSGHSAQTTRARARAQESSARSRLGQAGVPGHVAGASPIAAVQLARPRKGVTPGIGAPAKLVAYTQDGSHPSHRTRARRILLRLRTTWAECHN